MMNSGMKIEKENWIMMNYLYYKNMKWNL